MRTCYQGTRGCMYLGNARHSCVTLPTLTAADFDLIRRVVHEEISAAFASYIEGFVKETTGIGGTDE